MVLAESLFGDGLLDGADVGRCGFDMKSRVADGGVNNPC